MSNKPRPRWHMCPLGLLAAGPPPRGSRSKRRLGRASSERPVFFVSFAVQLREGTGFFFFVRAPSCPPYPASRFPSKTLASPGAAGGAGGAGGRRDCMGRKDINARKGTKEIGVQVCCFASPRSMGFAFSFFFCHTTRPLVLCPHAVRCGGGGVQQ